MNTSIDSDTTYQLKPTNTYVTTKYGQVVDQDDYYEYFDGSSSYGSSHSTNHNSITQQSSDYDYYDFSADYNTTNIPAMTVSTTTTTTTTTTTPYFACKIILYEKTHFR